MIFFPLKIRLIHSWVHHTWITSSIDSYVQNFLSPATHEHPLPLPCAEALLFCNRVGFNLFTRLHIMNGCPPRSKMTRNFNDATVEITMMRSIDQCYIHMTINFETTTPSAGPITLWLCVAVLKSNSSLGLVICVVSRWPFIFVSLRNISRRLMWRPLYRDA